MRGGGCAESKAGRARMRNSNETEDFMKEYLNTARDESAFHTQEAERGEKLR